MTATMTIPTDAAELEEMLSDSSKMQDLFFTKPDSTEESRKEQASKRSEFLRAYARKTMGEHTDLNKQIKNEVQKELANFLREQDEQGGTPSGIVRPDITPTSLGGPNQPRSAYNPKAIGARIDKEFGSLADYLLMVQDKNPDSDTIARRSRVKNAFGTEIPGDGGFLVPEVLRANLLAVGLEKGIMRGGGATVIPMDSAKVPIPSIDSTTNVGSVYGGITASWVEEGGSMPASSASFGRVVLDAKKLVAYAEVPAELVQDSVMAFEAFINQRFPEAISFFEDVKFIAGTGVNEPLGFVNCPGSVSIAKVSGQPTKTIVWENTVGMYARLFPSSMSKAKWVCSIDCFPQLATMALSVGTGGGPVWMGNYTNPGTDMPPVTILGRPVEFTEKAPVLGTVGDINLLDPSYYLIGDRQAMTASSSEHYKFGNDLIAYRFIERADGRPWLQSSITPENGGPNLSAFVTTATR